MRLVESDGKALLRRRGLSVPSGVIWDPSMTAPTKGVAIKAQMLRGGRGKSGLVVLAEPETFGERLAAVQQGMAAIGAEPIILVEDKVEFSGEYYLSWRIDDVAQSPTLMFSVDGGVDIESEGARLHQLRVDVLKAQEPQDFVAFFRECGVSGRTLGGVCRLAAETYSVFRQNDMSLIEINPLGVSPKGDLIIMDAKVVLDDNAAPRHRDWRDLISMKLENESQTALENRAAEAGVTFVEMDGDVALFTSGAGLGMALLDLVADHGMRAANFIDVPGGSAQSVFRTIASLAFERADRDDVKAILLFFTLSATSLKSVVDAIMDALDESPPPKPLIAGFVVAGAAEREMTLEDARNLFAARGYACVGSIDEAVAGVVQLAAAERSAPVLETANV